MRTVSAREAHRAFSRLLDEVEGGAQVVITRRGRPVAILGTFARPAMTHERRAAVERALALLDNAPKVGKARRFTRDEMHER
jgi:antitoxin (DNA-binding transcriptional repressor) of toxin-antitoxin stability system